VIKPLNVKPKVKKVSPEKPIKLKKFLDKMKLRKQAKNKGELSPKISDKFEPVDLGKTGLVDVKPDCALEIDHKVKFLDKSDQCRPNNPIKPAFGLPNIDENVRKKPERFSDIASYFGLSNRLVGASNSVKSDKPTNDAPVGTVKRRKRIKKKEEVLVDISSRNIRTYFPSSDDFSRNENGKRKLQVEISNTSKKLKVGKETI